MNVGNKHFLWKFPIACRTYIGISITTSGREIAVWCEISPYHETGSLTSCPANEGVLAVSKMSQ